MMQEFVQAVKDEIDKKIAEMHTCVPGKIISFDPASGLATVLPTMQFKKPNREKIDYPQIAGVPVVIPQSSGQDAVIAYPVKEGDGCLIIFSEQSIDYWMYGQQTDTDLKFDLTNAICIPGLFPTLNPELKNACTEDSLIIKKGPAYIKLKDGELEIMGNVLLAGNLTVTGDVTASGKSLKSHTHTDSRSGTTTAPN